jgi:hypothetical protein
MTVTTLPPTESSVTMTMLVLEDGSKIVCKPPFAQFARGRTCQSLVFSNEKLAITLVLEEGSVFNIKGQNWMLVALFTGERNVSLPEALMFKAAHHKRCNACESILHQF